MKGRRFSDSERIDYLRQDFLKCSSDVSMSISNLTEEMRSIQTTLENLSGELRKYNDSGLPEIIRTYNEQKGFIATSSKYGKVILWIVSIGGGLMAIQHFFFNNFTWPK